MKIINPSVELIQQEPGLDGMFRHIEKCGRTCYKSEDKITDGSANTFVANLIFNKHYAMLEHGTVYLFVEFNTYPNCKNIEEPIRGNNVYSKYLDNPYSELVYHTNNTNHKLYITTNYRVLVENNWLDDLQYICEPTEFHTPRITLKFITNIGVTREGNRMRANSIAEESTRYCNYTKDKFGGELNICRPVWITQETIDNYKKLCNTVDKEAISNLHNVDSDLHAFGVYMDAIHQCEISYNKLIKCGWTPQQAREVLPLATKSEVVYTAFPHQWKHFFDLRLFGTTGKPHPNMQEIAELAQGVLEENGLWELIYPSRDKIQ